MKKCGFRIADCGLRNEEAPSPQPSPRGEREHFNPQSAIRNREGFTLLEVMVAVSIMAMVLVSLLGLKNRSMQDVMLAEHITTATMLARRMMVETLLAKPRQPAEDEGVFPEEEYQEGPVPTDRQPPVGSVWADAAIAMPKRITRGFIITSAMEGLYGGDDGRCRIRGKNR